MAFNIQTFKSTFADGGARPTLYEVQVSFPNVTGSADITGANGTAAANKLMFSCVGASLPTSRIGVIEVPYFGRTIKVEGNRSYPEWVINVINDESMVVRTALEAWHAKINSIIPNLMSSDFSDGSYKVSAYVRQYAKSDGGGTDVGNIIREYEIVGMFPTDIQEIRLGWDQRDQIETYQVSFAFDWWNIYQSSDVNAALGTVGNVSIPIST